MMMYLSMIELMEDREKFERIYLKYRKLMFHAANQILKNPQDSEDAVQQAFVSIIQNLGSFSEAESDKTRSTVVLITERKAIDMIRTSHRDKVLPLNEDINGISIPLPGDLGVADAMARLPSRYREILLLKFDNGYSNRELAALMGIGEAGIRQLIRRARKALAEELQKEEIFIG